MSELKAMGFVGVGTVLLFAAVAVVLVTLHAGGEWLMFAFAFALLIGSLAMTRVIEHYETVDQRREREATLLR